MSDKHNVRVSSGGLGCVLWIIAGALIFIGLILAGFQPAQAGVYASGAVVGLGSLLAMLPCGMLCVIFAAIAFFVLLGAMINGARKDLHVSDTYRRW